MSNPIEEMLKKFSDLVPEPLRHAQEDLEKNMRGVLESGLHKMNLVTREEFDIQSAVLLRTREKLEALEARLAELEQSAATTPPSASTSEVASDIKTPT